MTLALQAPKTRRLSDMSCVAMESQTALSAQGSKTWTDAKGTRLGQKCSVTANRPQA